MDKPRSFEVRGASAYWASQKFSRRTPSSTRIWALRQNVIRRVENLTGLEVTEVNIAVNDVTFPE